jgi:acyl-CoA synthetase (AMP-forming)/AMP-acid ligase II
MNIWSLLERAASLYPEHEGVVDGDARFTYAQVRERSAGLAAFFVSAGIQKGDRVSALCWNSHEFIEAYFACAALGAVLNPLNVRLALPEFGAVLDDCRPRWLIADARLRPVAEGLIGLESSLEGVLWTRSTAANATRLPGHSYEDAVSSGSRGFRPTNVVGSDLAHLYYTSGTTGSPKGVMLTHDNVCLHALGTIAELRLSDTDCWGHFAPMFHLADAWATFAITWCGGRHVVLPHFDAEAALELVAKERITISNWIPTMLVRMVRHPRAREIDTSSLRMVLSGGAPIAPTVVRDVIDAFGCEYVQTYGMTETSPYLTLSLPKGHMRTLSAEEVLAVRCKTGRPFATVELRVVDDAGRDVPRDDRSVGEIWVRGDTVTPGYWNRPDETRAAFSDGWLKTGDLAAIDAEGYVTIVDRKKDMILSGGENVYSIEVESALLAHPGVLEAAVFGVPDADWGESVRAAIVMRPGEAADAGVLQSFCRDRLAAYKVPRGIEFLSELPRTGSGKIAKRVLRQDLESALRGSSALTRNRAGDSRAQR